MLLSLKNIGRFYSEAKIEINGITIIAGENGTGKSTIGKALYCVFNSLHEIKNKVYLSRINSVRIRLGIVSGASGREKMSMYYLIAKNIIDNYERDHEKLKILLVNNGYLLDSLTEQEINSLLSDIMKIAETDEDEIVRHIVENEFSNKFAGQLQHVNHTDEPGVIDVSIRESHILIEDHYEAELSVKEYLPLVKDIIYFDDEYSLENNISLYNRNLMYHDSLQDKIILGKKEKLDIVGDILSEERYKRIIDRMNSAHIGELIREKNRDFEYKEFGLSKSIRVENMSSGVKIMVLLKHIMLNGYLEDNGIIILDEPEIHLHPEWQKMLAEIIVIMQVEFNMNVLISTHSSDFLAFIQYYTRKYLINENNKVYLIKKNNDFTSNVCDVTTNIDEVYRVLGEPFIEVSGELKYES
ncbi:MAG: ATP-binding protein [Lachnospiraceae bacterium]|nr:ATP-binding protein [Lachnospiraceae bacterium]